MLKKLFVISILCLFVNTVMAKDADKNMIELTRLLSMFTSYEAKFHQTTFDQKNVELQKMTGVMKLQKPDHFYWESDEPMAQQLISNGKTIWQYDADLEQVVVQDFAKQAEQAPVLVILKDPKSIAENYKIDHVTKKGDISNYYLLALDNEAVLKSVELNFTKEQLSGLSFIDSLQQKTKILFDSMIMDSKFEPKIFEFVTPEGVDVLYE